MASILTPATALQSAADAKDLLLGFWVPSLPWEHVLGALLACLSRTRAVSNRFRPDRHPRHPELLARLRPGRRQRLGRARAHLRDGVFAARLARAPRLDARATRESRHRPRASARGRVAQGAARLPFPRQREKSHRAVLRAIRRRGAAARARAVPALLRRRAPHDAVGRYQFAGNAGDSAWPAEA